LGQKLSGLLLSNCPEQIFGKQKLRGRSSHKNELYFNGTHKTAHIKLDTPYNPQEKKGKNLVVDNNLDSIIFELEPLR
jgi:hypothetical protein